MLKLERYSLIPVGASGSRTWILFIFIELFSQIWKKPRVTWGKKKKSISWHKEPDFILWSMQFARRWVVRNSLHTEKAWSTSLLRINFCNYWNSVICHSFPRLIPFLTVRTTAQNSPSDPVLGAQERGTERWSEQQITNIRTEAALESGRIQTHGEWGWMRRPSEH